MLNERILKAGDLAEFSLAFVVNNLKTGESVSYNENAVVPAASLIKIPVMAEIFRRVKSGTLSMRRRIWVTEADKVPYSIISLLESGNHYSIHDLITFMIVLSDNTAANVLIDIAGFDPIYDLIRSLNLKDTILRRKMMDFQAGNAGRENYTTARDMSRLLELLYRGEVVDQESSASMLEIMKQQQDRTMMRLYIPDQTVIAHKTGELDHVSHEAGIVYHGSGDYILVVLTWDAPNNMVTRQSIGQIAKIVYDYFTEK